MRHSVSTKGGNTTSFSPPNLRFQEVRDKYACCLESIVHVSAWQGLMLLYKVSSGIIKQSSCYCLFPGLKSFRNSDMVLLAEKILFVTAPNWWHVKAIHLPYPTLKKQSILHVTPGNQAISWLRTAHITYCCNLQHSCTKGNTLHYLEDYIKSLTRPNTLNKHLKTCSHSGNSSTQTDGLIDAVD